MHLSVAIPCFNEEKNIRQTVADVLQWFERTGIDGEVIVTDDGSTDGSAEILKTLALQHTNVRIVTHGHNRGYGAAVRSALDCGTKEYLAYIDGDGQFAAEDFDRLIPHLQTHDFVTGRKLKRADPLIRRLNAKCYAILVLLVLRVWVRDINCAMKIFRRSIWPVIRPEYGLGALFNGEMFYRLRKNGIRWKQVFVRHFPRRFGTQTGASPRVIARMFREIWQLRCAVRREMKSVR